MPKRRTGSTAASDPSSMPERQGQRLDQWLWCTRLTKTRSEAARLISAGAVRINRRKVVKPAAHVHVGDIVSLMRHERLIICRVLALARRRISAHDVPRLRTEL